MYTNLVIDADMRKPPYLREDTLLDTLAVGLPDE